VLSKDWSDFEGKDSVGPAVGISSGIAAAGFVYTNDRIYVDGYRELEGTGGAATRVHVSEKFDNLRGNGFYRASAKLEQWRFDSSLRRRRAIFTRTAPRYEMIEMTIARNHARLTRSSSPLESIARMNESFLFRWNRKVALWRVRVRFADCYSLVRVTRRVIQVQVLEHHLHPFLSSSLKIICTVRPGRIRARVSRRHDESRFRRIAAVDHVAQRRCNRERERET
jgi:hypothetical protein